METSYEIKELVSAIRVFQANVGPVSKDAVNPFFKSKYASLENVIETVKEELGKNGLSFSQFPDGDGLTTMIMHTSGEWIRATANLNAKDNTPQGHGSAITYMRRYALCAALGLATEDDDGNSASAPRQEAKKAPQSVAKPEVDVMGMKQELVDLVSEMGFELPETVSLRGAFYSKVVKDLTGYTLVDENLKAILGKMKEQKQVKKLDK